MSRCLSIRSENKNRQHHHHHRHRSIHQIGYQENDRAYDRTSEGGDASGLGWLAFDVYMYMLAYFVHLVQLYQYRKRHTHDGLSDRVPE